MHLSHVLLAPLLGASALARSIPGQYHHNAARSAPYAVKEAPLTTSWTDQVGTNPWPEYPRPQLQRTEWQNLNGVWQYQNASNLSAVNNPPSGQALANEVLVPSCLESSLSGWYSATDLVCIDNTNCSNRNSRNIHVVFMVFHLFQRVVCVEWPASAVAFRSSRL